ncbi:MAG: hypothetical protein ACREFR_01565 [Limisphaerales bacterium]
MKALETRKRALQLESDLNRLRLRAELNNLRELCGFAKKFKPLARFGAWPWALASLTGIAAALGLGRSVLAAGLLRKAMAAAPVLIRLWRTVSSILADFR